MTSTCEHGKRVGLQRACQRQKCVARDAMNCAFALRHGTFQAMKLDCGCVPVEYPPFKPSTASIYGDIRDTFQNGRSCIAAPRNLGKVQVVQPYATPPRRSGKAE